MDHSHHSSHGAGHGSPSPTFSAAQEVHEGAHGMKMYFHAGFDKNILVYGWDADSNGKMIGTFIAVFVIGVVYESIKFLRQKLAQATVENPSGEALVTEGSTNPASTWANGFLPHFLQSMLYGFQVAISFILMLFAMTFNIWIFLAVIFGMTVGYLAFAPRPSRNRRGTFSVNDCCNYTTPTVAMGGDDENQVIS